LAANEFICTAATAGSSVSAAVDWVPASAYSAKKASACVSTLPT
jgi:hypothetical protein